MIYSICKEAFTRAIQILWFENSRIYGEDLVSKIYLSPLIASAVFHSESGGSVIIVDSQLSPLFIGPCFVI